MRLLVLLSILLCATSSPTGVELEMATLVLRVDNIRTGGGTLWIGIYESEEDFLDREKSRLLWQRVGAAGSEKVNVDKLVVGKSYAIGIFHDENDNGELDTNFFGLPAEPWAFSRPLQSWFRKPRFEEMSFVFQPELGLPPLRLR